GLLGHERTGLQRQGAFTSAPGNTSLAAAPAGSAVWVQPPKEDHLPFNECSTPEKWRREFDRQQREEQGLDPFQDTDGSNLDGMDEEMKRKWFDKSIPMYPEPPSATTSKSASSMSGSSTKRGHTFHDNFLADSTKVFDLTEDELDLMSMEKKARTDEHAQRLEEG
ncbi:hypothetical protein B484DRAFT_402539, partial [Ochromonadaceae sp. CCMP2298]